LLLVFYHDCSIFLIIIFSLLAVPELVGLYDPGDEKLSKVMVVAVAVPNLVSCVLFMGLDYLIAHK
jgi:hypothetical protein